MSNSLWPHGLQHTRLLCHPLSPRVCSNSCPLSQWCYLTISSSTTPFSFCLQSFPASGSFPMCQLFASDGQSIGNSASAMSMKRWKSLSHAQPFATLAHCSPLGSSVHEILSPGKNNGVGSYSLLQRVFPTQRSKLGVLRCMQILYNLSHQAYGATKQIACRFFEVVMFRNEQIAMVFSTDWGNCCFRAVMNYWGWRGFRYESHLLWDELY